MSWTADQILALAPDASSAKAGRGLAHSRKWTGLGRSGHALWGLCQGSGKDPYQTRIELSEPAFKCSCPSRKFPCKHALGLFLILAESPTAVKEGEPPAWVTEWLEGRKARSEKKEAKKREDEEKAQDPDVQRKRAEQQQKRAAKREDLMAAGLEELERWMRDLTRQGLASLQGRGFGFFDASAKRLVDAQAPGLARMVRAVGEAAAAREGWQARTLERLGVLHLAVQGYRRLGELPEATQSDLRQVLGWTVAQEDVLAAEGVRDRWQVLGRRQFEEDRLRVQRVWLAGIETGRPALVLSFAAGMQPLDASLAAGTVFEADLAFYPGAWPLRAMVKQRHGQPTSLQSFRGHDDLGAAFAAQAEALARYPWLEEFPMPLCGVTPVRHGEQAFLRDARGQAIPLDARNGEDWLLLALGGGHPVAVFGEWDGRALKVLGVFAEGRYTALHESAGVPGAMRGAEA